MPPDALISARVAREREWCHEAWLARLSWSAMRRLANLPESEGGLGYDLSPQALKSLVTQAREDRGDMTMNRADRLERQSAEVDMRARAARADLDAAYRRLAVLDAVIEKFEVYDTDSATALRNLIAERNGISVETERADRRLHAAQDTERKLHGLDAPTELSVDVTHRDAVDAELDAMLARLDPPKKKAKST